MAIGNVWNAVGMQVPNEIANKKLCMQDSKAGTPLVLALKRFDIVSDDLIVGVFYAILHTRCPSVSLVFHQLIR